jgi:hypothetical protein
MDINYYNKYLKYKTKYINLLNNQKGSGICDTSNNIIYYKIYSFSEKLISLDISDINNYDELLSRLETNINQQIDKTDELEKYKILKIYKKNTIIEITTVNIDRICGEEIMMIFVPIYNYKYFTEKDNNYLKIIISLFINDLFKDIYLISNIKPVSTIASTSVNYYIDGISKYNILKYNWNGFLPDTQKKILDNLSKKNEYNKDKIDVNKKPTDLFINMKIYVHEDLSHPYQPIFYSETHLNLLCKIFDSGLNYCMLYFLSTFLPQQHTLHSFCPHTSGP